MHDPYFVNKILLDIVKVNLASSYNYNYKYKIALSFQIISKYVSYIFISIYYFPLSYLRTKYSENIIFPQ